MAGITKQIIKNTYFESPNWTDIVKDSKFAKGKLELSIRDNDGTVYFFSVRDYNMETLKGLLRSYNKENPDNVVKTKGMTKEYYAHTIEMLVAGDRINNKRAVDSFNAMASKYGWDVKYDQLDTDDKADASYLFKYAIRKGYLDPNKTNYESDDVVRAIWETSYKDKQDFKSSRGLTNYFEKRLDELKKARDFGVTETLPEEDTSLFTENRQNKKDTKTNIVEAGVFDFDEIVSNDDIQENKNRKSKFTDTDDEDVVDVIGLFRR